MQGQIVRHLGEQPDIVLFFQLKQVGNKTIQIFIESLLQQKVYLPLFYGKLYYVSIVLKVQGKEGSSLRLISLKYCEKHVG